MLKSRNQPICSGQGITTSFGQNLDSIILMSWNKSHHKCFTKRSPSLFFHIPFSIFFINFSYPILGQIIATSGLRMIVICPAIFFSHLLTLPKVRQLLDIALSLEWIESRFQERRCDMTWHLLCAFVLIIFVMYHVFCCDMICYDICDDMLWYLLL